MTDQTHSYSPAHAHAPSRGVAEPYGSAPRNVLPSEELRKINVNVHTSSLTETQEVDDGNTDLSSRRSSTGLLDPRRLRAQALQMLHDRRVDGAEDLVDSTAPHQAIIGACEWWDAKRDAKPGLLVWKIRQGGVVPEDKPASKASRMRDVFAAYLAAHPVDSRLCSHMALAARKWPDDEESCPGQMIVAAAFFPVLEFECDGCGFLASLTPRAMRGVL